MSTAWRSIASCAKAASERASLALLLALAACGTGNLPPEPVPTASDGPTRPVLAYTTPRGVWTTNGNGRTRQVWQGEKAEDLTWSPDRSWITWESSGVVHLAATAGTRTASWPCSCSGAHFIGDRLLAMQNGGKTLYDLPTDGGPARKLPLKYSGTKATLSGSLLAGGPRYGLIAARTEGVRLDGVWPYRLFRLDFSGRIVPVEGRWSSYWTGAVSSGDRVAVAGGQHHGWCTDNQVQTLYVVDLAALTSTEVWLDMMSSEDVRYILRYGWGGDGALRVTSASAPSCGPSAPLVSGPQEATPHVWRLDGKAFTDTGSTALAELPGPDGLIATLTGQATTDYTDASDEGGKLVLARPGGAPVTIAADADQFVFAPTG